MSDNDQNGAVLELRLSYDDARADRTMPVEWAEHILKSLFADHKPLFAQLFGEAATGVRMRKPIEVRGPRK